MSSRRSLVVDPTSHIARRCFGRVHGARVLGENQWHLEHSELSTTNDCLALPGLLRRYERGVEERLGDLGVFRDRSNPDWAQAASWRARRAYHKHEQCSVKLMQSRETESR